MILMTKRLMLRPWMETDAENPLHMQEIPMWVRLPDGLRIKMQRRVWLS